MLLWRNKKNVMWALVLIDMQERWRRKSLHIYTSQRAHDINTTSSQHRCNIMTLRRCCTYVVNTTSPQHRCNVMTLHRRWGDVFTSCACMTLHRHWGDVVFTSCACMTLHRQWGNVVFTSCACRVCIDYLNAKKPYCHFHVYIKFDLQRTVLCVSAIFLYIMAVEE